ICSGSSTNLTLVGGGSGGAEVVKWYTGSCGGTLVATGNGASVSPSSTTTYYGRYEDGAPCSYNSTCQSITNAVLTSGTWLGVTANWVDAQNWCGGVPTSSPNVTIPTGLTYYPIIGSGNATTKNITISGTGSLTVNGTGTIQISGTVSNTGTF